MHLERDLIQGTVSCDLKTGKLKAAVCASRPKAQESQWCRFGLIADRQRPRTADCVIEVWRQSAAEFSLAQGGGSFCSVQAFN